MTDQRHVASNCSSPFIVLREFSRSFHRLVLLLQHSSLHSLSQRVINARTLKTCSYSIIHAGELHSNTNRSRCDRNRYRARDQSRRACAVQHTNRDRAMTIKTFELAVLCIYCSTSYRYYMLHAAAINATFVGANLCLHSTAR